MEWVESWRSAKNIEGWEEVYENLAQDDQIQIAQIQIDKMRIWIKILDDNLEA